MQVCPHLCGMHTNLYRGGASSAINSQATIRLQSHNRTSSATAAQAQQDPGGYIGTDGRRKATFEEAWSLKHPPGDQHLPWRMSWQRNEKDLKFTDQTRAHLVQGFAARELGISSEEMSDRMLDLVVLLPDLPSRLALMKSSDVSRLAQDTQQLAGQLVSLKDVFPAADLAGMAVRQPDILVGRSTGQVQDAARQLRGLLPSFDIDWLVEQHPQILLDPGTFAETLAEARRVMPGVDVAAALRRNPSMIFGFERRSSMIPYDS